MGEKGDFRNLDDRELFVEPGVGREPGQMVRQFGCYASILLVAVSWLSIGAVMLWQEWPFALWPFGAVPAIAWVVLLAAPLFVKFRRGALTTADAVVKTSEAYLARAGYTIDINRDGAIGHNTPKIKPAIEEHRPIIMRGRVAEPAHQSPRLSAPVMTDQAPRVIGDLPELEELSERPEVKVKVWHLPNGEKIEQSQLEQFVDGIFIYGWGRGVWLEKGMRREVYEGAIGLLEDGEVLIDRKKGFAGRLSVRNSAEARVVLDLPE